MQIQCPNCRKVLRIADNFAGKKLQCPLCRNCFVAPTSPNLVAGATTGTDNIQRQTPTTSLERKDLQHLLISYIDDIEKSIQERNEAMEMVDNFFQFFLDKAGQPGLSAEEQQDYQDIAQKLFQLQKKFPLLSGFKDVLLRCQKYINS